MRGPGNRVLHVYTDNGCPEVDRQEGLNLIQEIENAQLRNAQAIRTLREGSNDKVNLQEALKALPMDPSLAMQWLAKKFPSFRDIGSGPSGCQLRPF